MNGLIGKKTYQTQAFLQDGTRVPLTAISAMGNMVAQLKKQDRDGYNAVQVAFDIKKKQNRAISGHSKKAGLTKTPRFFKEIRVDEIPELELGSQIEPSSVFKPGDIVDVTGVSKGKGFAGVVKRHHFAGGPRTHGQSDRERAPGSIGQTTTPGRVYRGKRMAGRMGHQQATAKNLMILDITNDGVLMIKGLVPGGLNNIVVIKKVGKSKKFVPLYKENTSQPSTLQDDAQVVQTETKEESQPSLSETRPTESAEDKKEPQSVLNSPASEQPPVANNSKTEEVKENAKSS